MAGPLPRRMCDPQSLPLRGFHAGLLGQGRGSGLCRLAVDQFLQLLAGLEVGDAPRRHVHPRGATCLTRDEVVEAALAHTVRTPTEAAYARSDLFERRRRLMDEGVATGDAVRY